MLDLATELSELESTLADAGAQLTALSGDSSQEHLAAVGTIVAAMEQARLSAESRQLTLDAQDAAATAAAAAYFDAIAWAREAMTTGGDLSSADHDAVREQLRDDLGLVDLGQLDTLLGEVQSYDNVGSDAVDAARIALVAAEEALATAEEDMEAEQTALDAAGQAVSTLAEQALASGTLAYQQLAAVEDSSAAGRLHEAVVHLQDLTSTRDALNAAIALDPPRFDANETDSTTVTTDLTAAWTAARDSYEAALATLVDAQETFFEAQLSLASAEADAQDRAARRLIDAAQQVADRQATL